MNLDGVAGSRVRAGGSATSITCGCLLGHHDHAVGEVDRLAVPYRSSSACPFVTRSSSSLRWSLADLVERAGNGSSMSRIDGLHDSARKRSGDALLHAAESSA
jgi:hypothetical protein